VLDELEAIIAQLNGLLSVSLDEDGELRDLDLGLDRNPIGALIPFAGNTAPAGWLACDGAQRSRVTNKALFEVIGTTYGAGDGSTTFNLPNMRGRFPLGVAASGTGSTLGETGGSLNHTHSGAAHTHTWSQSGITTSSNGGFSTNTGTNGGHTHGVSGNTSGGSTGVLVAGSPDDEDVALTSHTHSFSVTSGSAGDHSHSVSNGDHTHSVSTSGTTSSSGTGDTGTANPPFLALAMIIFCGI
jgi:microcystin-dependent protein